MMSMLTNECHLQGTVPGLGLGFSKLYGQDRVMVTYGIWLSCEFDCEVELQCFSESGGMFIFMVHVCSKSQD